MLFALLLLLFSTEGLQAQINFPPPSPEARVQERVGFTRIHIHYERPAARGRKVFGGVVPFNEIWRTGAGDNTTLAFSEDVRLAGNKIPKGKYSLFTIPGAAEWIIILNKDTTLHGTGGYKPENDMARFPLKPDTALRYYENFTIAVSDVVKNNGVISLSWENTEVSIPLLTRADETIMAEISQKTGAGQPSPMLLYQAANYYFENDKDAAQAMSWIDKAIAGEQRFIFYHLKAKLLAKQGAYKQAIKAAQKSAELAKEAKVESYVQANETLIAGWRNK